MKDSQRRNPTWALDDRHVDYGSAVSFVGFQERLLSSTPTWFVDSLDASMSVSAPGRRRARDKGTGSAVKIQDFPLSEQAKAGGRPARPSLS